MFRCRTTAPKHSPWGEVEAETPEDAVQEFHLQQMDRFTGFGGIRHRVEERGCVYFVNFARVEVEGHEAVVTRIFEHGIWRRGGVKPRNPTLKEIAEKLGWKHDPKDLLGPWEGEETMEEARARQDAGVRRRHG
jgi:hypothetical protein